MNCSLSDSWKNNQVGCHFLLQVIFPTQGSNLHLVSPALTGGLFTTESPGSTIQFSSVAQSCLTLQRHGLQHVRPLCTLPTPRVYSNPCPLSRWCHPTILSSVIPFFSHLHSFPASGSFQLSQFFASGGQNTGVSASASVLPVDIQDWFPLGCTDWISLQSQGLSRIFSNTTV